MSTVTTENETIVGTVQLYVDGVAKGDTAKLEQASSRKRSSSHGARRSSNVVDACVSGLQ